MIDYTRVCYDVTGIQHTVTEQGNPQCGSLAATEHYDEGMDYKLCATCYPVQHDMAGSVDEQVRITVIMLHEWACGLSWDDIITGSPDLKDKKINDFFTETAELLESQQATIARLSAELADVNERLDQTVAQRHEALLKLEAYERDGNPTYDELQRMFDAMTENYTHLQAELAALKVKGA